MSGQKGGICVAGGKTIRKILLRILGILVSTAILVLLTVSLILAKPQEKPAKAPAATPSAEARPAIQAANESELTPLVSDFPAPVMSFTGGSGMVFVSATSADTAYGGGFARVATLCWQTADSDPVTLQSIWPADALSLLDSSYHFMNESGPSLFGGSSLRMENDDSVRIHTATEKALYVALFPRSLSGQANDLCRFLQLFTVAAKD